MAAKTSQAARVISSAMMMANLITRPMIFSARSATAPAIRAAMISKLRIRGLPCFPPAQGGHDAPDRFHHPEGPGALQKAISRTQPAGQRKGQNEMRAALFQRIGHQHQGDGEKPEQSKPVHGGSLECSTRNGKPFPAFTF